MPAVIPFIPAIAAVIGGASALTVGVAIVAAGVAYYSYRKAKKLANQSRSAAAQKQMFRDAAAPKQLLLGHPVTSGPMIFAAEQGEPNDKGEGETLHIVVHLAGHPCESVTHVWLNDEVLSATTPPKGVDVSFKHRNGAGWVHIYLGNHTTAPATLKGLPDWSANMVGKQQCFAHVVLRSDPDKWPAGLPNVKCAVKGVKVEDPRTGKTQWTDNPALLMRWYRNVVKHGVPMDEAYVAAANICDEVVDIPQGQKEYRYRCNYAFPCNESPRTVTAMISACCAGNSLRVAGRHSFQVGAYYGPGTVELSEKDIVGDLKTSADVRFRDRINTVTATYLDPTENWNEVEMPRIQHAGYLAEDEVEIVDDLNLECCPSPYQAQRVAQIHLNTTRQGCRVEFPCNLRGVELLPGTVFKLNFLENRWHNLEFKVESWKLGHKDGVVLQCMQHIPENYGWSSESAAVPSRPGTPSKKDPTRVETPSNLLYQSLFNSNTAQALISWQHLSFGGVTFEVSFYQAGELVRTDTTLNKYYRLTDGFSVGRYEARVRARNAYSVSNFASLVFTTTAPQTPVACHVELGNWSITMKPVPAGLTNLDTAYDFAFGFDKESKASDYAGYIQGRGRILTMQNLKPDTEYYFAVREISRWGESGWFRGSAKTEKRSGDILEVISGDITQQMLNETLNNYLAQIDQRGIDTENALSTTQGNIAEEMAKLVVRDRDNLSAAMAYTRTAVGYCIDEDGNITDHNDAVACTAAGHKWLEGPLSEFIRHLAIDLGDDNKASVNLLAQAFVNKDGKPVARGSMTTDVNGKVSGFINSNDGTQTTLDFIARYFRLGDIDDKGNFVPSFYLDTVSKLLVLKGRLILGDGYEISSANSIRALSGEDGVDGSHGAGFYTLTLRNGRFPSDELASGDFEYAYKRKPVQDDHLTYRNAEGTASSTKRFDGNNWLAPTMLIHGDMLATGTISGDRFKANSEIQSPLIKGGEAGFGEGGSNDGYHTYIDGKGLVKTDNIQATGGRLNKITIEEDCIVLGTVLAEKIVGDVVSSISKNNWPVSVTNRSYTWARSSPFGSMAIAKSRPWNRTLQIYVNLTLDEVQAEFRALGEGRIVIVSSTGQTYYSRSYRLTPRSNSSLDRAKLSADISMTMNVPANQMVTFTLYAEGRRATKSRTFSVKATISATSTNNIWTGLLLSNGGDLS